MSAGQLLDAIIAFFFFYNMVRSRDDWFFLGKCMSVLCAIFTLILSLW